MELFSVGKNEADGREGVSRDVQWGNLRSIITAFPGL